MKVARNAHALGLVEHAAAERQLALDVGQPGKFDLGEIVVMAPPGGMDIFGVDRCAEQLRVAVAQLALDVVEADDLGRAHEGEILGPEEYDQPFALRRSHS